MGERDDMVNEMRSMPTSLIVKRYARAVTRECPLPTWLVDAYAAELDARIPPREVKP